MKTLHECPPPAPSETIFWSVFPDVTARDVVDFEPTAVLPFEPMHVLVFGNERGDR